MRHIVGGMVLAGIYMNLWKWTDAALGRRVDGGVLVTITCDTVCNTVIMCNTGVAQ